ncbi:MAG: hypothetical protein KFF73_20650 [Cyclobacteriaceae bacterium]|nr:hypothetical protein [Cyclobacteriaceae bacterium]
MKQYIFLMRILLPLLILSVVFLKCTENSLSDTSFSEIIIYPDSILNDVSNHPVGINLDYFMDDDNYLNPERSTADALGAMGVRYLRYPGGNKSDFYFFSKPPWEKAIPTLARTGKGAVGGRHRQLRNYSEFAVDVLDFDEFIAMCRKIDAVPVVTVAADEYLRDYPEGTTWSTREELIEHAVEWVRYSNVKKGYDVKYWMIGNESWHKSNPNSTAEIYARDVVDFSKAMKAVDSNIYVIPNGNSVEFLDTVLTIAGAFIDHICISNYPIWQYKVGYATYRDTLQDLMHPVQRAIKAMKKNNMPEKMKVIIAEYGPFDWAATQEGDHDQSMAWQMNNDMGHAMCNFEMTGKQLEEPEVKFSCFWNTRWINNDSIDNSVYDALDREGNFNANGYSLLIWGNYLGDKMIKTEGTTHLRSFAATLSGQDKIRIFLLNVSENNGHVKLSIPGYTIQSVIKIGELTGNSPEDTDPVWKKYDEQVLKNFENLVLPGTSITVAEVQLSPDS